MYALLGPTGAGKTTMVRLLSTLISADDGEARVAGFDVRTEPDGVRRSIGVTGQFFANELLSGREYLRLMADLGHLHAREAVPWSRRAHRPSSRPMPAGRRWTTTTTGTGRRRSDDRSDLRRPRLGHDAAAEPQTLFRYPWLTLTIIGMPMIFLLLFVYVCGGTMGAGLPGGIGSADHRAAYLRSITPAILVMTSGVGGEQHCDPGREGRDREIIDRFRTMPIPHHTRLTSLDRRHPLHRPATPGHLLTSLPSRLARICAIRAPRT